MVAISRYRQTSNTWRREEGGMSTRAVTDCETVLAYYCLLSTFSRAGSV